MSTETTPRHLTCSICSQLRDEESAIDYVQTPEDNTNFPEAIGKLKVVKELHAGHPGSDLMQCPECGTYYHYRSIYEYLIGYGGSYDEYILTRIDDETAKDYLEGRRDR